LTVRSGNSAWAKRGDRSGDSSTAKRPADQERIGFFIGFFVGFFMAAL